MLEINLKNLATTQAMRDYNSLCRFGDHYLGANASGLFELGGATDDGVGIAAIARTVTTDMGDPYKKQLIQLEVGLASPSDLQVEVFVNDTSVGTYAVSSLGNYPHRVRVKLGKGAKGRYIAFQFTNPAGAAFTIYGIDLHYHSLRNEGSRG